jgi:hypothetical protein
LNVDDEVPEYPDGAAARKSLSLLVVETLAIKVGVGSATVKYGQILLG